MYAADLYSTYCFTASARCSTITVRIYRSDLDRLSRSQGNDDHLTVLRHLLIYGIYQLEG